MKIGFIGVGSMAQAIIQGMLQAKVNEKDILVHSTNSYQNYAEKYDLTAVSSNQQLVDQSDIIVLAVLPNIAKAILSELNIPTDKPIASVVSGFDLKTLSELTNANQMILRTLPNINSAYGSGMTVYIANDALKNDKTKLDAALKVFADGGEIIELTEAQFPIFSAISGSGVAYIDYFIESLSKAGVKYGLSKKQAVQIVSQTTLGSADALLKSKKMPTEMIDLVSSPGGDTIAGLLKMEQKGLLNAVIKGIDKTVESATKSTK